MSKNFVLKTFDQWFVKNRSRFKYKPVLIKSRKDYFLLQFKNIAQELTCTISEDGVAIWVTYKGREWDALINIDTCQPRRTPSGHYYCNLCEPKEKRIIYSSREELLSKHLFEPLLAWINENFAPSYRVGLLAGIGGKSWTSATIIKQKKELKKITASKSGRGGYVDTIPIVRPKC